MCVWVHTHECTHVNNRSQGSFNIQNINIIYHIRRMKGKCMAISINAGKKTFGKNHDLEKKNLLANSRNRRKLSQLDRVPTINQQLGSHVMVKDCLLCFLD